MIHLREGKAIPEGGEDWKEQAPPLVSEHLGQVTTLAEGETLLVRASSEDWGSEGFQGRPGQEAVNKDQGQLYLL